MIRRAGAGHLAAVGIALGAMLAGCTTSPAASNPSPTGDSGSPTAPATVASTTGGSTGSGSMSASAPAPAATAATHGVPSGNGPVIVIDPGHSPSIKHVDAATGLVDSDYENEPEMRDVFAVALLVKAELEAAGYRVVMTKRSVDDRVSLGERAAIANRAHAALAISIHDQAGASGGIQFSQGNNIVYYQSVGNYRETPTGKKVVFTNAAVAATSKRFGLVFQTQRAAAEGATIRLQGNVGYDLGTRGLPPGNIWMVQLLSRVPWIYNEAGGNSAGRTGLDAADEQKYADGLVASIERCVPIAG